MSRRSSPALLLAALLAATLPVSPVLAQGSDTERVLLQAIAAYDDRRYDQALRLLEESLGTEPDRLQALYYTGLSHIARGRADEAAKVLERARTLAPSDPSVLFQLGVAYYGLRRYDTAEALFTRVFDTLPQTDRVGYYLGFLRYRRKDYEGALRAFRAGASSDPAVQQLTQVFTTRTLAALRLPRRAAVEIHETLGKGSAVPLPDPAGALRQTLGPGSSRSAGSPRAVAQEPGPRISMPPQPLLLPGQVLPQGEPPNLPAQPARPGLRLTLKESLLLALQQNLDIQAERLSPDIAATDIQKERGQFDPSATSKITNDRLTKRKVDPFFDNKDDTTENLKGSQELSTKLPTGTTVSLTYEGADARDPLTVGRHSAGATLKVVQSLLKQFGLDVNLARTRIAEKTTEQARADLVRKILDVAADVQNTYWDLYRAQRAVEIRRESYDLARNLFEQKRSEVDLGILAPVEIIDVQADLANKVTEYLDAVKTLQETEVRLKTLLNQPLDLFEGQAYAIDLADAPTDVQRPIDPPALVDAALKLRPEYRRLQFQAESKELEVLVARNQQLPDLEFTGSFSTNNLSHANNFSSRYPWDGRAEERIGYEVGLKFVYIFGNNAARADHQRRLLELSKIRREQRLQEQTIKREIANGLIAVESGRGLVTAASNALALQEKNVEAARQRLQFGVATIRDVIDIQSAYIEARLKHITTQTDLQKAFVTLYRAQGTLDPQLGIAPE